ncbi:hypothetical protein LCGC14_1279820 [marine sediment metagenome]|uniref:Uncharacterized protein n=1 Tax=marine sediment metagenome TaxID=412755 RepID=A0A0F9KXD9_9ZZZZ
MKIKGFDREKVIVTKERDSGHDHLIITIDDKQIGYFHISKRGLEFFDSLVPKPKATRRVTPLTDYRI